MAHISEAIDLSVRISFSSILRSHIYKRRCTVLHRFWKWDLRFRLDVSGWIDPRSGRTAGPPLRTSICWETFMLNQLHF